MTDKLTPFAEQVTNRPFGFRINVARGKQPQAKQVREPLRIMLIVGVLEPTVLRKRWGMGEVDVVARLHEPIDEPVPIIGGFNDHTLHRSPIRLQRRQEEGQVIAEAFLIQHSVRAVDHDQDTIRGMEIDARITHHHRNLLG
jgi:hypothetical protein